MLRAGLHGANRHSSQEFLLPAGVGLIKWLSGAHGVSSVFGSIKDIRNCSADCQSKRSAKANTLNAQIYQVALDRLRASVVSQLKGANMTLNINGTKHALPADPRVSLLDFIRHDAGLTGTKKGCDHGQCGACTVIVNGERINSCLSLAVMHDGDEVTTIEGLGTPTDPSPLQKAFVAHDGYQCGYCTPGQICSATAMMNEIAAGQASDATADVASSPALTDDEIRERMSGNLCRCGAYPNIVAAIREVMEAGK